MAEDSVEYKGYLGYIKYSGKLVESGLLDARKAAQALLGFDQAIRFLVGQQSQRLKEMDFELPVRIRHGSWEALIPEYLPHILTAAATLVGTTYATTAAKKMAERDFATFGVRDIVKSALRAIQWFIRIGKHTRDTTLRKFHNLRWRQNNSEVGIPNDSGEYLYVPANMLKLYLATSPQLLVELATIVERERTLSIAVNEDGQMVEERITTTHRRIFTLKDDDDADEVLFPELKHGDSVILEGRTTRGTETANTIGFRYQDHILTCIPDSGSIVRYKSALFLRCRIHGTVTRSDALGGHSANRPRIIFDRLEPLEPDEPDADLFDKLP
jgi:hypothetical protein